MAPALTQAAEHPSLVEATRPSPPPPISTAASPIYTSYEGFKLKGLFDSSNLRELKFIKKLISNGDRSPSGLAPPAFGRAEGCPVPPTLPRSCTMEEPPPLQLDESNNLQESGGLVEESEHSSKVDLNMGFHSTLPTVVGSPNPNFKVEKEVTPSQPLTHDGNTTLNNQQNEFLALMGRDFNNVNEIIDTLQRIASNPEFLNEAGSELSSVPPIQNVQSNDFANCTISRLAQRQRLLEQRRLFLVRRLQRITARGLGGAISVQLSHLVRHGRATLSNERLKNPEPDEENQHEENIGIGALHKESMKNMSTSDLVTLVRRMEASQNLQRMNAISKQASLRPSPALPAELCEQIDTVASEMRAAALSHVHHDSDATESSSGGESCDEHEGYQPLEDFKSIRERAFYKYCRRRGFIASKWVWLQSQIANLDEKINQQEKKIMQLRSSKIGLQLTEDCTSKVKLPIRSPAYFDAQDPALTCIATSSSLRTTINGYHPPNKVEDPSTLPVFASGGSLDVNNGCARTMGVKKLKRRKYIRPSLVLKRRHLSTGVTSVFPCGSTENSKSACHCVPPLTCILCPKQQSVKMCKAYGNFSSNFSKSGAIIPIQKTLSHRLAELDPRFHPALSQPLEMLQGEVFGGTMLNADWYQRAASSKPILKEVTSSSTNSDDLEPYRRIRRDRESKRNAARRWRGEEGGKERITLRLKKSLLANDGIREGAMRDMKRQKFGSQETIANKRSLHKDDTEEEYGIWQISSGGSTHCSPCPSPALSDKEKWESKDKNLFNISSGNSNSGSNSSSSNFISNNANTTSERVSGAMETRASNRKPIAIQKNKANSISSSSSYDINNIVIPHSMAAVSRVEPLQYKEIMTPKWRLDELYPLRRPKQPRLDNQEDEEDISDEAFTIRHNRSEELERRKFLQYLQMQSNSVRSRTRRTDSSGTNTPDNPLSPHPETSESSPMASPPRTPQMIGGPSEDSNQSTHASSLATASSSSSSSNQATVLTLSLSSLQSSMLKSNNQGDSIKGDEEQLEILNSSAMSAKPSSTIEVLSSSHQPVSRMKRLLNRGKGFQPIAGTCNSSVEEVVFDGERVSPFPCRTFPLKENEYEDLVLQTVNRSLKSRISLSGSAMKDRMVNSSSASTIPSDKALAKESSKQYVIPINVAETLEEAVSGRDSPLSELTDSAPDEEDADERCWDSSSATAPDWTISAIQDDAGCYVLQVQRN